MELLLTQSLPPGSQNVPPSQRYALAHERNASKALDLRYKPPALDIGWQMMMMAAAAAVEDDHTQRNHREPAETLN